MCTDICVRQSWLHQSGNGHVRSFLTGMPLLHKGNGAKTWWKSHAEIRGAFLLSFSGFSVKAFSPFLLSLCTMINTLFCLLSAHFYPFLSLIIRCPGPFYPWDVLWICVKLGFFLFWFSIIWQGSAKRRVIILWEFPVLGMHVILWWVACILFTVNQELAISDLDLLWSLWTWKHPQSRIVLERTEFGQCWGLGKAPLLNKCGDKWLF